MGGIKNKLVGEEANAKKRPRRFSDQSRSKAMERLPVESPSGSSSPSSEEEEEKDNRHRPEQINHSQIRAEDVRVAKETAELFKSNVMKLQIDEVLKELAHPAEFTSAVNTALHMLRKTLLAAESSGPDKLKDLRKKLSARLPIPESVSELNLDPDYEYEFHAPSDINIIGSYFLGSSAEQPGGSAIDLLVEMPEKLFHPKDYLNFRFYSKRAVYVSHIATLISQNKKLGLRASYEFDKGDCLRPVISLEFESSKISRHFHILVHFGANPEVFPVHKLGSDWNAIRSLGTIPTPRYNLSVLSDLSYGFLQQYLHTAKAQARGFTDACKLGRLWLAKRGFGSRPAKGGFGAFEFSLLMASLLQGGQESGRRILLPGYSSFQLFRGVVTYLSISDVRLQISTTAKTIPVADSDMTIQADILPINFLGHCPAWTKALLKHEAYLTAQLLSDLAIDRFSDIFIKQVDVPQLRFDYNIEFEMGETFNEDFRICPSLSEAFVHQLHSVMTQGLGVRIQLARIMPKVDDTNWSLNAEPPLCNEANFFEIGLLVDRHEAEKRVTYGPSSEDETGIKAFKELWGSRSSLRRFQDGSIREAVVWNSGSRPVVIDVLDYIVSKHLDARLNLNAAMELSSLPDIDGKSFTIGQMASFQAKINDFDELSQKIQGLEGLPLRIASIYSTSSSLRFTSIDVPTPIDLLSDDAIGHGIINLESSSKWPDDIVAIEKIKIALLVKLAELLRQHTIRYEVTIGVETNLIGRGVESGFILISTPAGYAFKLVPMVAKVEHLLANQKFGARALFNEESLLNYQRHGPKAADHNRQVITLALRQPLYSVVARMLKFWFKKQLLGAMFSEQAIELISMKVFVDSAPYSAPNSAALAFNRTLAFLSTWSWRTDPLILSFNHDISGATQSSVQSGTHAGIEGCSLGLTEFTSYMSAYKQHRERDPALTLSPLFIASSSDPSGILWTQTVPRSRTPLLISTRLTALARSAIKLSGTEHWPKIFKPSLSEYDLLFRIRNPSCKSKQGFKNLQSVAARDMEEHFANIGAEFYEDIAEVFRDSLILFYSGAIDDRRKAKQVIAGVWNRDALGVRPFKVNTSIDFKPTGEGEQVKLNKSSVVREILRLGGDMIELVHA